MSTPFEYRYNTPATGEGTPSLPVTPMPATPGLPTQQPGGMIRNRFRQVRNRRQRPGMDLAGDMPAGGSIRPDAPAGTGGFSYGATNTTRLAPQPIGGSLAGNGITSTTDMLNPDAVDTHPTTTGSTIRDRFRQAQQRRGDRQTAANPPIPDPNGSLRGDIYTPGNDPRLTGAQGATDAAGNAIQTGPGFSEMAQGNEGRYRQVFGSGQVQGGPRVAATDAGRYLSEQDQAVAGLGGPNRTELAKTALADFDTQDLENRQKAYRKLTQNAAGGGRLGLGDEARKVLDTERLFNQDRMRFQNELARDVSEGDIEDRFRRVGATSGLRRGEADIGSGLRGEERTERGYSTGLGERNVEREFDRGRAVADYGGRDAEEDLADRYSRYDAAGNLEDRIYGQGQSNRGEYRTERGRQDVLAQQTLENRIRQREMERLEMESRARIASQQGNYGG